MLRKGFIGFTALLMTAVYLFLVSPASAAQYVIHPSGANASNCATFSSSAATNLDTHDSDTSYASTSSSTCDLYMEMDDPSAA
ncbi:MAG: hypothetical protein OEV28_09010, partial [Nitrospirota bacterium]|nr:hypothetical protein [Nitrospirota bacterium]